MNKLILSQLLACALLLHVAKIRGSTQCQLLPVPENGELKVVGDPEGSDMVPAGTTLFFSCAPAYKLNPDFVLVCVENLGWMPKQNSPTCEYVGINNCTLPPTPAYGSMRVQPYTNTAPIVALNTLLFFSCREGYELTSATVPVCIKDLGWTAPAPKCKWIGINECTLPETPMNGEMTVTATSQNGNKVPVDSTLHVTCNLGFQPSGYTDPKCMKDVGFYPARPSCIPECPIPAGFPYELSISASRECSTDNECPDNRYCCAVAGSYTAVCHLRQGQQGRVSKNCPNKGPYLCRPYCDLGPCTEYPDAVCKLNYCHKDGCVPELIYQGNVVDATKCTSLCTADKPLTQCVINPCQKARCWKHPTATCKNNYCGGCHADFYKEDGTKLSAADCLPTCASVNNNLPVNTCADECTSDNDCSDDRVCCSTGCGTVCLLRQGQQPREPYICPNRGFIYFRRYCNLTPCKEHPEAKCKLDCCYGEQGCEEKLVNPDGSLVDLSTCSNTCNQPLTKCLLNPCLTVKCNVKGAKCFNNFCGGCKAEFYKNGRKIAKCSQG